MLDIAFIRENPDAVKKNIRNRGMRVDIDQLLRLDEQRREMISRIEALRAERNRISKTKPDPSEIDRMRALGEEEKGLTQDLANIENEYLFLLRAVPNLTHPEVPIGGEEDYTVLETVGKPPKFDFEPKDHEKLLLERGLIDFERGAKVTGSKFFYSKGDLVRLNHALIAYGLDTVERRGYTLVETPDLAKDKILTGIGFNPRGPETQVYSIENSDLSLIGTAEITIGGYHADEILDLSDGPKRYAALSHCFRTEAGAYGRESRGLYRVHQFTKLELFVFCKPEESERFHQELLDIEKELADGLQLPYRVIDVASGDLGGPAYRKFDVEAWMVMRSPEPAEGRSPEPAEGRSPEHAEGKGGYGEITSASNCTDYQARRLNIRYRTSEGEAAFVHTLNGTALNYSSRWPIALIENHQQADGTIRIPEALRPYMGGREVL